MTDKTHARRNTSTSDAPIAGTILFAVAMCLVTAAFMFWPTRGDIDDRISRAVNWIERTPTFLNCRLVGGVECRLGYFFLESRGGSGQNAVFVLFKDRRAVASIVRGEFFVESNLSDAERVKIRSEFAGVVSNKGSSDQ